MLTSHLRHLSCGRCSSQKARKGDATAINSNAKGAGDEIKEGDVQAATMPSTIPAAGPRIKKASKLLTAVEKLVKLEEKASAEKAKNPKTTATRTFHKSKQPLSPEQRLKRAKRRARKGTVALREIRKYQKSTELLIRKVGSLIFGIQIHIVDFAIPSSAPFSALGKGNHTESAQGPRTSNCWLCL